MSSIYGILNTARQGIFTSQKSLAVTSQNIANVSTPGYSLQRPQIAPLSQLAGAKVSGVERIRNDFLDKQRALARSSLGLLQAKDEALTQVESILDETGNPGTNDLISVFFKSIQDLSLNPRGLPEREGVRSNAVSLSRHLHSVRQSLVDLQRQQDRSIVSSLDRVNQIAAEIASINPTILANTAAGLESNELIDKRNELVNELSEYVPVQTYQKDQGPFTVIIGNGLTLVEGNDYSTLEPVFNPDNNGFADVALKRTGDILMDVTGQLDSGRLGGYLQARDATIAEQIRNIDRFAAQLATRFNVQHRQGFDLASPPAGPNTNIDFFDPVAVYSQAMTANAGGASVAAASVADQTLLTFDEYEIRFTAPNAYDVVDVTTGATVVSGGAYVSGAPIDFDGVRVAISNGAGAPAAGDVFKVDTVTGTASSIDISAAIKAGLSSIAASADGVPGDNGNALKLASLESKTFFNNGTSTFSDFLVSNLTALGIDTQRSHRELEGQQMIVDQVNNFIQSYSGVSLDEESMRMIEYQRSYQACARVVTTVDEMLQTLIAM